MSCDRQILVSTTTQMGFSSSVITYLLCEQIKSCLLRCELTSSEDPIAQHLQLLLLRLLKRKPSPIDNLFEELSCAIQPSFGATPSTLTGTPEQLRAAGRKFMATATLLDFGRSPIHNNSHEMAREGKHLKCLFWRINFNMAMSSRVTKSPNRALKQH